MKKAISVLVVLLVLASYPTAREENNERIALPSARLLRCKSSDCLLWSGEPGQQNVAYPKQVILDMNRDCLYGMTVLYDKSVSIENVKEGIDGRYGNWAMKGFENLPVRLWRVESEHFSIQLSEADKKDERAHTADAGTKQVIYLAFGGRSACSAAPS